MAEARGNFPMSRKYVVMILERLGMVDCKPVTTPLELDFKKLSVALLDLFYEMPPSIVNSSEH